jgi:hypothetical protein
METQWDENRYEKDRKTGCSFMKPYCFTPVPRVIGLSDDRKDARKINSRTNTKKKEKEVKSLIAFCPPKSKKNKGSSHMAKEISSFISPRENKPSCRQKG